MGDLVPREAVTLTVRLTLHDEGDCVDALGHLWTALRRVQAHMTRVRRASQSAALLHEGQAGVARYRMRRFDGRMCVVVTHPQADTRAEGLAWADRAEGLSQADPIHTPCDPV